MKKTVKIQKVLDVFRDNYEIVPLEVFGDNPYQTLVSTVMSARTNDDTTLAAANRLFVKAPDIHTLASTREATIQKLIYPVGFYKTKAKHIKKLAQIVQNEFRGVIPQTREELMTLPGVGRKTANLVLNRAFGQPAIAVDTHVHRISNILGWVNTKTPHETELALMAYVPQEKWVEMNVLFVSIGRQFRSIKQLTKFLVENKLI